MPHAGSVPEPSSDGRRRHTRDERAPNRPQTSHSYGRFMTITSTPPASVRSARRISAETAAGLVRTGDWVDYGAVLSQPDAFDTALAARAHELHDVRIRGCLSLTRRAVVEADPEREHFSFLNWHLSGYD